LYAHMNNKTIKIKKKEKRTKEKRLKENCWHQQVALS
jgi:hypothetical protein